MEFYIELKNKAMIINEGLTKETRGTIKQVSGYSNILNEELTSRGIGEKMRSLLKDEVISILFLFRTHPIIT